MEQDREVRDVRHHHTHAIADLHAFRAQQAGDMGRRPVERGVRELGVVELDRDVVRMPRSR